LQKRLDLLQAQPFSTLHADPQSSASAPLLRAHLALETNPPFRLTSHWKRLSLVIDLIMRNDPVVGFLQFYQLAELGGRARFAFADDVDLWFEDADELPIRLRVSAEHSRPRLPHHLLDSL